MPVYMLRPDNELKLRRQALRCVVWMPETDGGPARVSATTGGAPAHNAIQERTDSLVLSSVEADIVIQVSPPQGLQTFPAGSILQASVLGLEPGPDPERVNLERTDLSGLGTVELIRISPADEGIRLRAATLSKHQSLTPLGDAARMITAELLGTNSVPAKDKLRFIVGLDTSMSFRRHAANGTLHAAIDMLSGIASVLGEGERVVFRTNRSEAIPSESLVTAGDEAERIIADSQPGTLFEVARIVDGLPSGEHRSVVFVISDSVAADFARQAQGVDVTASLAAVVLGPAAVVSRLTQNSGVDVISIGADGDGLTVEEHYLEQRTELREIVSAFLRALDQERSL